MPIYEYRCNNCGNEFEKLVFSQQKVYCSKCQSEDVQKKFSLFAMSGVKSASSGCTTCSSSTCSSCK